MSNTYAFRRFTPLETPQSGIFDSPETQARTVIALDIQCKYQFADGTGNAVHEYQIPGGAEIHNCAGYVDKLMKYKDPAIRQYFEEHGVSLDALKRAPIPILQTRSPQIDAVLLDLIEHLRKAKGQDTVSLLDHGCTVGEHYDMLELMLQARSGERLPAVLRYCGLDSSALVLAAAYILHMQVPPDRFRLIQAEGSAFDLPDDSFDLSLTVGVVNHVADPRTALRKLLAATRHACVMAVWVTGEDEGFWAINHSGVGNYFFSRRDFQELQGLKPNGRFLVMDFTPETAASQPNSYVGLGQARLESLGCYQLLYTTVEDGVLDFPPLVF